MGLSPWETGAQHYYGKPLIFLNSKVDELIWLDYVGDKEKVTKFFKCFKFFRKCKLAIARKSESVNPELMFWITVIDFWLYHIWIFIKYDPSYLIEDFSDFVPHLEFFF